MMKEIVIAENYEEEEEVDRLSFCYLPLEQNNSGPTRYSPRRTPSARTDHLFEFFIPQPHSNRNDIVFCGKIIQEDGDDDQQLNEYEKRDYLATIKTRSYRGPTSANHSAAVSGHRVTGELSDRTKWSGGGGDVDRVNISSLTSMSAKSRRRMFMFGPVRFRPEVEMRAIKQRQQARRPPATASGGSKNRDDDLGVGLRGRSNLTRVLARSLGCIPVACGGGGGVPIIRTKV